MKTYNPQPVTFEKGDGACLWDEQGKQYLDALSGIAVCGLGHAHPDVAKALCDQGSTLIHTSNIYRVKRQQELADLLCNVSGMDSVFFSNSGAEANEAAIKLARMYGSQKKIGSPEIIVMEKSFHGRTLATLSATGNKKIQAGFEPLVTGFIHVPFNDIEAINRVAQDSKNIVAVLVEPVQGEGGIRIPDENYLNGIREICDRNDWLMMLDEIQTGMCRSGKWFAHQYNNISPDVMTLAKGLGNGVPIGACLAKGRAARVFQPGTHGSTYGGNPLVCHVAKTVIETLDKINAPQAASTLGKQILDSFREKLSGVDGIQDIRGMGLLLAIELDRPCAELVGLGIDKGILINVTDENVIRLLPPIIITGQQAEEITEIVSGLILSFLSR